MNICAMKATDGADAFVLLVMHKATPRCWGDPIEYGEDHEFNGVR
jgi:hypothetical protein